MAPKQKDKYSDKQLDPSEQAFDDIVSRPDMQALDDQGDSIARDTKTANNLSSAENESVQSPKGGKATASESGSDDQSSKPSDSESNYWKPQQAEKASTGKGWSNRKKGIVGGLGAAGLGGLIMIMLSFLPLKVPGLVSLVTQETAQKLENVTEKRAKLILGRAILTKFGSSNGVVLTGDGAFATLVASMRTSNFEKKLAARGLTIEPTKDGVKLRIQGGYASVKKGGSTVSNLTSEDDIIKALDGSKQGKILLKDLIKEEIPSWRWMKRAKFAKWMRIKYGIPKYGLKNSTAENDEDKKKEMDTERAKAANARSKNIFSKAITCLMSGSCDGVDGSDNPSQASSTDADVTNEEINKAATEAEAEIAEKGIKAGTSTMVSILIKKLAQISNPVGWIDLVATIDHHANNIAVNDYLGKIAANFKALQYAAVYAEWAGYGSQIQLGAMDPVYVGALADTLNDAEKAQAYQAIQGNPEAGEAIETTVDSDRPSNIKKLYDRYYETFPPAKAGQVVIHGILNLYYESVGSGGLLGWISSLTGNVVSTLLGPIFNGLGNLLGAVTPDSIKEAATKAVTALGGFVLQTFGLTIDALDTGAGLFNNITGGSVVATNEYCKEIGCRKLTAKEAYEQTVKIAAERNEYRQQKGLAYALFSSDEPRSLTNQLIASAPTSPTDAVSSLASLVTSAPSKVATMVAPRSSAASAVMYESLYHVQPYGATTKDIEQSLSPEFLGTTDGAEGSTNCPTDIPEGAFDVCKADTIIAEAMRCEFEPEIPDCADTDATEGGFDFRLSSFNALDGVAHAGESRTVAGGNCADNECMQRRTDSAVKMIKEGTDIGGKGIDLIGMQEVSDPQYEMFKKALPDYGVFPKDTKGEANQRMIMWNSEKFEFVTGGTLDYPWYGSSMTPLTWVQLRATGGSIFLYNVHPVAGAYPGEDRSDVKRARAARIIMEDIKKRVTDGSAVFITGDMNATYMPRPEKDDRSRDELPYCIFTKDGSISNTLDLLKKRTGACPNTDKVHHIDHAYASSDVTVTHWAYVKTGIVKRSTDHEGIVVTDVLKKAGNTAPVPYKNAVFDGNTPDPSVIRAADGTYHLYASGIQHLTSPDLVHWKKLNGGVVNGGPGNARGCMWAPDVAKIGDTYYFTYTGGNNCGPGDSAVAIHYATSKSAGGPFTYRGVLTREGYAIDSHIFVDGETPYLFFGGGNIRVVKLEASGTSLKTTGPTTDRLMVRNSVATVEGSWVEKHNDWYYLFYSFGNYRSTGGPDEYSVRIARSKNIRGPYEPQTPYKPVLTGKDPFRGPGHNSVATDNAGNAWIVYHAYEGNNRSDRKLMIDPITYESGWPVVRDGHPSSGLQQDGPANGADGGSLSTGKGGWIWPLKKGINPGPCYGGPRVHAGMDMNTETTTTPVYAMHSGTVARTGSGGAAGNYITIKATGAGSTYNNQPVFYSYEHLKSGSIKVGTGDTVTVGKQVGIAGTTGNVSLGASKAHLHIVTARTNSLGSYGNLGTTFDPMNVLKGAGKPPEGYVCEVK